MTNTQNVNAIEFLIGALRAMGFDKSAADEISQVAYTAMAYGEKSHPNDYNPEHAHAQGFEHGANVSAPNIEAFLDPTG